MTEWTAHRWGTVIAAAVHAEVRKTHSVELSKTDPVLCRAVAARQVAEAIIEGRHRAEWPAIIITGPVRARTAGAYP